MPEEGAKYISNFYRASRLVKSGEAIKELSVLSKITKFTKWTGAVGNIVDGGVAVIQFAVDPTVGNATRVGVKGVIIGITVIFPVVGLGLGIAEWIWGDKIYNWIDGK